jgi:crossover junction endodeoxyribonuclease RusA
LPPSVNAYWRNFHGRTILSKAARDYKQTVKEYVLINKIPYFGDARLQAIITIFPKDRRKQDLDNRLKSLLDSLGNAGVFDDDSQFDMIETLDKSENRGEDGKLQYPPNGRRN